MRHPFDFGEKAECVALFIANEVQRGSEPTPMMVEQANELLTHLMAHGWKVVPIDEDLAARDEWHEKDCGVAGGFPHSASLCAGFPPPAARGES